MCSFADCIRMRLRDCPHSIMFFHGIRATYTYTHTHTRFSTTYSGKTTGPIFTARCVCISAVCRHPVSVRHVRVSCAKTNKDIFELFSPSGSQAPILVFLYQTGWRYTDGNPLTGVSNAREYEKMTIFDQYLALSEKRL